MQVMLLYIFAVGYVLSVILNTASALYDRKKMLKRQRDWYRTDGKITLADFIADLFSSMALSLVWPFWLFILICFSAMELAQKITIWENK